MNASTQAITFFFGRRILNRFEFSPEDSHHIVRVLRHQAGDVIWAIDGSGTALEVELDSVSPRKALGVIVTEHPDYNELPQQLILVCGMIQPGKMDWLVEKSVELGVHRVYTVHATVKPGPGRLMRWARLARSAAKQCKRGHVPEIDEPAGLEEVISRLPERGVRLLADSDGSPAFSEALGTGSVTVAVGPERGFSQTDKGLMMDNGFAPVSLGLRRLRAETAAVSILSLVSQRLEGRCQGIP